MHELAPLPASVDAERCVLGTILLDNLTYRQAAERLRPDDFSLDSHRRIFGSIMELAEAGRPVDLITLAEELSRRKQVDAIGGMAYLASLTDGLPHRADIGPYVRIVRDKAVLRRIIHHANARMAEACDPAALPEGVLQHEADGLRALQAEVGWGADWRGLFHTWDEFASAPPLRFAIEGFLQDSGITLIGGLAGHGKTLVMLAMARALLEPSPLFGYERFRVAQPATRVLYLVPESSIGPFGSRLRLFRLEEHIRRDRLLVHTLSSRERVSLTDPKLLKAAAGAHVFLDTVVRFMDGAENDVASARVFANTLLDIVAAGARTITGAHHAPKSFETQERMTLENILRGSGDLGAMLCTAWGLRQIDADANRIYVQNVKARDFEPCAPFIIQARPYLDQTGQIPMLDPPGTAGELRDYVNHKSGGRPASLEKDKKVQQARTLRAQGASLAEIATALGISKTAAWKWLHEDDGGIH